MSVVSWSVWRARRRADNSVFQTVSAAATLACQRVVSWLLNSVAVRSWSMSKDSIIRSKVSVNAMILISVALLLFLFALLWIISKECSGNNHNNNNNEWWYCMMIPSMMIASNNNHDLMSDESLMKVDRSVELSMVRKRVINWQTSAVVSLAVPLTNVSLLQEMNHWLYAARHGYEYFALTERLNFDGEMDPALQTQFQKTGLLRYLLHSYSSDELAWFLWIDGDALFMNCSLTIDSLRSHASQMYGFEPEIILSGDSKNVINNGVILLRNSDWVRHLVDDWFRLSLVLGSMNAHRKVMAYYDQSVLMLLLGGLFADESAKSKLLSGQLSLKEVSELVDRYERPLRKKRTESKNEALQMHRDVLHPSLNHYIAIVEQTRMNSYRGHYRAGQWIQHFAGQQKNKTWLVQHFAPLSSCASHFSATLE